jgi:D-alanyl-D-alanine dipeptidase
LAHVYRNAISIARFGDFSGRDGFLCPENAQTYQGDLQSPALPVMPVISDLERRFLEYGLVDLGELKPDIRVDLQYSGTNNIMHTDMYGSLEKAYLHPDAAQKLVKASTLLKEQHGLQLLIYDAARPLSVQKWMWEQLDLPYSEKIRFLNPPEKTSLHNYGAAVDLTIIDADGVPLDMGTPYDDPLLTRLPHPGSRKPEKRALNSRTGPQPPNPAKHDAGSRFYRHRQRMVAF